MTSLYAFFYGGLGIGFLRKYRIAIINLAATVFAFIKVEIAFAIVVVLITAYFALYFAKKDDVEAIIVADDRFYIDKLIGIALFYSTGVCGESWEFVALGALVYNLIKYFEIYPINKLERKRNVYATLLDDIICAAYSTIILTVLRIGWQIFAFIWASTMV